MFTPNFVLPAASVFRAFDVVAQMRGTTACDELPQGQVLVALEQHEMTVTANNFRNLHRYGWWWYRRSSRSSRACACASGSDQPQVDRDVIGEALEGVYEKLCWKVPKSDIERDVQRLFGPSYEEYITKEMQAVSKAAQT